MSIWDPPHVDCLKHGKQPETQLQTGTAFGNSLRLVVCSRCLLEAIAKACPDSSELTEVEAK